MSAIIDGCYRYSLGRVLREGAEQVTFIMLNPSTADAEVDDPTIRRCVGYAKVWGADRLEVVNLFALRATNPDELRQHHDPVGPENDRFIVEAIQRSDIVVCAWGSKTFGNRAREVLALVRAEWKFPVYIFGLNRDGQPKHPLYLSKMLHPQPWSTAL